MRLTNTSKKQHVLITGVSSGLGHAVAKKLISQGAIVSGLSRSSCDVSEFELDKGHFNHFSVDVSDEVKLLDSIESAVAKAGKICAVVHCAGVYGPFSSIENVNSEEWAQAISINLFGTFNLLKHVPSLMKDIGGPIVCLSGGGATSAMPNISSYAASKAAVVRLVETAAEELANQKIYIYAIAPGLMATQMLDQIIDSPPDLVGTEFHQKMVDFRASGKDQTQNAVDLITKLIFKPIPELSGRLLSAAWDPWREWLTKDEDLNLDKDDYMLRRFVPQLE